MTGDTDEQRGETGGGSSSTLSTSGLGREYGRQLAVDVVTERDSGPSVASDGGLSPAARRWLDATPGADVDDAREYDREYQVHQELSRSGLLPPRGDPGDSTNYDRSEIVNAARRAVREYHDLEEQDNSGTD